MVIFHSYVYQRVKSRDPPGLRPGELGNKEIRMELAGNVRKKLETGGQKTLDLLNGSSSLGFTDSPKIFLHHR